MPELYSRAGPEGVRCAVAVHPVGDGIREVEGGDNLGLVEFDDLYHAGVDGEAADPEPPAVGPSTGAPRRPAGVVRDEPPSADDPHWHLPEVDDWPDREDERLDKVRSQEPADDQLLLHANVLGHRFDG